MPKSKTRKNHKQKVNSRNKSIADIKQKQEREYKDTIMDLIKQEQAKGEFENNKVFDSPVQDIPRYNI